MVHVGQLAKDLPEKEKVETGHTKFGNFKNLTVVHWKDERYVFALSTMHGNDSVVVTNKR